MKSMKRRRAPLTNRGRKEAAQRRAEARRLAAAAVTDLDDREDTRLKPFPRPQKHKEQSTPPELNIN